MSPAHDRFAGDWLALREPADHVARAAGPTAAAAQWLAAHTCGTRHIVDLGCGRGSNLRYLAPRLPGPQHWRLVDHDAGLLARALASASELRDADGRPVALEPRARDLRGDCDSLVGDARLVTAAALFDLVDRGWVDRLVEVCAQRHAAVLFTASVDGRIMFEPTEDRPVDDSDDAFVLELLSAHQHRDKGFGGALGPDAPAALIDALETAGYTVLAEPGDWRLDRAGAPLAAALLAGWRDAAIEQAPDEAGRLTAWARRRTAEIARGQTQLTVGHRDLFAAPATAPA
ncbi:class I SAM-dependent methyltransferase [Salinisphaera sp. T31B1]|uniref:class I SAM-dependent methyltransferase n=1 Tax=Salinisphaera sp. T31B1 TaxID=727963 RepID=UPI00334032A5